MVQMIQFILYLFYHSFWKNMIPQRKINKKTIKIRGAATCHKELALRNSTHEHLTDVLFCESSIYGSSPKCEICHKSWIYEKVGTSQE